VKVAIVYESFGLSGSLERQRVLLSRALVSAGVEVHYYGNVDERSAEVEGVIRHSVFPQVRHEPNYAQAWDYARFALAATRALRRDRRQYDIIDVAGTTAWEHDVIRVHAVTAAEQRRWPTRGGRSYSASSLRARTAPIRSPKLAVARTVERLQYRPGQFSLALALTDEVRRDLLEVHGVPEDRVEVQANPVDVEGFRAAPRGLLRNQISVGDDVRLVLFVGHAFDRKGLADAIAALADVDGRMHLVVVGDDNADPYERLARELGVRDRVHFVGSTETPETYFLDSDLFVLPTREDVWGNTLVEAMAAGLPIVTTDVAGASNVVEQAGAGFVVPAGSVRSLRDAVAQAMADPGRRREMAIRGKAAAAEYSLEAFGTKMLVHYERAQRMRKHRRD
jgi:glycosyltransferase involved in cell wall biosynthesis